MDNDLDIVRGQKLARSYTVLDILGEGAFAVVAKCQNTRTNRIEAIKVNRTAPKFMHQAFEEISFLKRLRCLDADACNIVKWNGYFFHEESICMMFEPLDQSLDDYLEERGNPGLPVEEIRPVLHQVATGLSHLHSIGVAHLDLKPQNIMVVDRTQQPVRVKIIDFGLSGLLSKIQPNERRGTPSYMAPEMMLAAPYDETFDMWSLGLIAAELAIGFMLYPGYKDYDVLSYIVQTQGQPPDDILDRGMRTPFYFYRQTNTRPLWRFKSPEEFQRDSGLHPEDSRFFAFTCLDGIGQVMAAQAGHHSDQQRLLSLIKSMLHLDAGQRVKAREALQHPFFAPGVHQKEGAQTVDLIGEISGVQAQTVDLIGEVSGVQAQTVDLIGKVSEVQAQSVDLIDGVQAQTVDFIDGVQAQSVDLIDGVQAQTVDLIGEVSGVQAQTVDFIDEVRGVQHPEEDVQPEDSGRNRVPKRHVQPPAPSVSTTLREEHRGSISVRRRHQIRLPAPSLSAILEDGTEEDHQPDIETPIRCPTSLSTSAEEKPPEDPRPEEDDRHEGWMSRAISSIRNAFRLIFS